MLNLDVVWRSNKRTWLMGLEQRLLAVQKIHIKSTFISLASKLLGSKVWLQETIKGRTFIIISQSQTKLKKSFKRRSKLTLPFLLISASQIEKTKQNGWHVIEQHQPWRCCCTRHQTFLCFRDSASLFNSQQRQIIILAIVLSPFLSKGELFFTSLKKNCLIHSSKFLFFFFFFFKVSC